jgi:myo-inositol-1(or 4)-monophosphatase
VSQLSANLTVMIAAARKAGRILVRDFGEVENLLVSVKGAGDFVSAADIRAEQVIRQEVTEARPAYGWLGEESGETAGKDPRRRWIVDPIDGTTNFLHGLPHFAISIGLEQKGEITAGVVFDPIKNELFFAEKGFGAFMNDRRIRVAKDRRLGDALFATGVPFGDKQSLPELLPELARLMPASAGLRRWGVASLDLCYVAAGRFDGYWERELQPWDMAAGIVIAREAGAFVTDLVGKNDIFARGDIIAGAPDMMKAMMKHLAPKDT